MYRIMLVMSKKAAFQSLYQFLTKTVNGVTEILEIESKEALDTLVESMLNSGYAKSDFIIVRVVDYELSADHYTDETDDSNSGDNAGNDEYVGK